MELIKWWTRQASKSHQLALLPRGHQKSELVAYRVAWEITRNPAITILYLSSTSGLAEQQLKRIKAILTSKVYRRYWPDMVNEQEGKRALWNNSAIEVDHPLRKTEGVRDATVFTGGLTTSLTGFHCDIAVLDDVVVQENAYTNDGRTKVKTQYSLLSSIENPGALEWVVGTRYHAKDLYTDIIAMEEEIYSEEGELVESTPVFEIFERVVEDMGDGTGEFLWPRQQRGDGKWFGFNTSILMKKKAQYLDKSQYYAQYYNNPNDPGAAYIEREAFRYYDRKHLKRGDGGYWYYKDRRLATFAAIDFAFSVRKRADYTAIVSIGMDVDRNIYLLEIDRFKTDRVKVYYEALKNMHIKWGFKKLRAEVTVAQKVLVNELRDLFKEDGIPIKIDDYRPQNEGSKEERMRAALEHRYDSGAIYHYEGGNCQVLEEELMHEKPAHDDVKDSLSCAVTIASPPNRLFGGTKKVTNIAYHPKFGGVI